MLVLPYGHEQAPRRAGPATLAVAGAWLIAAVVAAVHDLPLEQERRRVCEEAAIQLLRHPSVAADAPGWPGCPLEEYARRASVLHGPAPPAAERAALLALVRARALRAQGLAEARVTARLGYRPEAPTWHALLTTLLLFAGPLSLLPGLLCLLVLGPELEGRRGPWFLVAILATGAAAGVLALGAGMRLSDAEPAPGAAGGLACLVGLSLAAAPRARIRLFWCFWWFRWGRVSVPGVLAAPVLLLAAFPWSIGAGASVRVLLLHGVPLALGTLAGAGLRLAGRTDPRRRAVARATPPVTAPEPRRPQDEAAPEPTSEEEPARPDWQAVEAPLPPEPSPAPTPRVRPPRLLLRRAGVVGLREDRAILAVGPAVVEQLWDEIRCLASGAPDDIGPLLDLVVSLHETPSGPTAFGMRLLATETDFDALFHLAPDADDSAGFSLLLEAVGSLVPHATRLPDDDSFRTPARHTDESAHDEAVGSALAAVWPSDSL